MLMCDYMQNAVRTTIRIRKDLLDQSKLMALEKGTSIQEIINSTLAAGFGHVTDLTTRRRVSKQIDKFRKSLADKSINVSKLVAENRRDLP